MTDDPVTEAFRQLERYERSKELPDIEIVTDAWIILEVRRREREAKVDALRKLIATGSEQAGARRELTRLEGLLKDTSEELDIVVALRDEIKGHARGDRDYEAARASLARLRKETLLKQEDRTALRDSAVSWRGEQK